jgi:large subunit ribosomal protein L30
MAKEMAAEKIKITLVKSGIGYDRRVRETIKSLGLGKLHSSVIQAKTPDIVGKARRISHLVITEDLPAGSVE